MQRGEGRKEAEKTKKEKRMVRCGIDIQSIKIVQERKESEKPRRDFFLEKQK